MLAICVFFFVSAIAIQVGLSWCKRNARGLPLPPGPKPYPLIGRNFLQFPMKQTAKVFTQWRELYGDIIYTNDIGGSMLVLNSRKACADLLDRRSAIYSDRPFVVMFHEVLELDWEFGMTRYSERWRQHRRLFHQYFNEHATQNYREIQELSAHAFLNQLLQDPEGLLEHIRVNFVDSILRIVYDIPVESYRDTFVEIAEKAMKVTMDALSPAHPVNLLPVLKHLPSWFPGGDGFHKYVKEAKLASDDVRQLPFEQTQRNLNAGLGSSVLQSMLEKCEGNNYFTTQLAMNTAANAFLGGSDTLLSSVKALFIALANNPDVQKRAQIELDAVTNGPTRLPTFSDMQELPYINAIVKEILRWHNVLPLGLPHRLTKDDIYNGYSIPEGTLVFVNIWAILHDPKTYPDPYTFNPSRWLVDTPQGPKINDAIPDPDTVFGAGRRICPGRHVARNSLFITVASVLACFDISPLDMAGKLTEHIPENMTDGMMVHPLPFKVSIIPRSERVVKLIAESKA